MAITWGLQMCVCVCVCVCHSAAEDIHVNDVFGEHELMVNCAREWTVTCTSASGCLVLKVGPAPPGCRLACLPMPESLASRYRPGPCAVKRSARGGETEEEGGGGGVGRGMARRREGAGDGCLGFG